MLKSCSPLARIVDIVVLALLAAAAVLYDSLNFPLSLCLAVIMAVVGYRQTVWVTAGSVAAVVCAVIAAFLYSGQTDATTLLDGVIAAFDMALPGAAIGIALKKMDDAFFIVSVGAGANILVLLAQFVKLKLFDNIDILNVLIKTPLKSFFDSYESLLSQSGTLTDEMQEMLHEASSVFIKMIEMLSPALLIISALLSAFFIFLAARKVLYHVYKVVFLNIAHFWALQLGRKVSVLMFGLILATMLLPSDSIVTQALLNITVILSAVYVLCGLSVIDFFFRRTKIFSIARALIYVLALILLFLFTSFIPIINPLYLLMFLGLFDSTFDFRKLRQI